MKAGTHLDTLKHLNNNQICAIDICTTGPDPRIHELISLAILPLDGGLKRSKYKRPIDIWLKPEHPDVCKFTRRRNRSTIAYAMEHGLDRDISRDIFYNWFQSLLLREDKKLGVIACGWMEMSAFLIKWLGEEHFRHYFMTEYRDLFMLSSFFNDRASFADEPILYPGEKTRNFSVLVQKAGLNMSGTVIYDTVFNAYLISEVYRKMLTEPMI